MAGENCLLPASGEMFGEAHIGFTEKGVHGKTSRT